MKRLHFFTLFLIAGFSCGHLGNPAGNKLSLKLEHAAETELDAVQQNISHRLDTLFTNMNERGIFNGSVLVARAGKILYQRSLGLMNKRDNNPLNDSSMFQLASVSKVITATAVLMLHERHLLNIESPVTNYLPDFPYQGVTIRQLLSHRSGLPNYLYALNSEICRPDYRMSNVDMYNSLIAKNAKPYLRPDTRFNYCNTNYAILALLIEKTSGKTYQAFLREELFEPLGMRHTATIHEIDGGGNTAQPYDHKWREVATDASDYVLGDKSIYSTPYDLFLFSEALYQGRIISPATQQQAYTAFSREKKLSNYGYGWRLKDFNDPVKKEVYHNGWWHGYRSSFHRRLGDSVTVVILSNQLNTTAYQTYRVYQILDNSTELATSGEE